MEIKDYDQLLYNILKPLIVEDSTVKIYRNVIDEDYDSRPDDYIVYSSGLSNNPAVYGDGKVLVRKCSCDITVNEAGTGNNINSGYLVNKVESLLVKNNIHYTKTNLGYIESENSVQTNFDFYLI